MKKRILTISGGATKFIGLFGMAEVLIKDKKYFPDIILGVSSGALAMIPIAMNLWDKTREIGLNVKMEDFYDKKPFKRSIVSNILNILNRGFITKKLSLGEQNVSKLLKKLISEDTFEFFKHSRLTPDCYTLTWDSHNNKRIYHRLKDLTYEQYLLVMEGTSAIPYATEPIEIDGVKHYDGGAIDHIINSDFLKRFDNQEIDSVIALFSRPKEWQLVIEDWDKNMIKLSEHILETTEFNKSKDDEIQLLEYCIKNKIPLQMFYCPKVLKGLYDTDKNRLNELYIKSKTHIGINYR